MTTIHIFNPDTDYALAADSPVYTPPAPVLEMRRRMALFPASYASESDWILRLDSHDGNGDISTLYEELSEKKRLRILSTDELRHTAHALDPSEFAIRPWGWNRSLHKTLSGLGVPAVLMPTPEAIADARRLSHRRLTVEFNRMMQEALNLKGTYPLPVEMAETDEVSAFCRANPGCFLKAPWSSAGRGVLATDGIDDNRIAQWTRGMIRRQGSVMGERRADRKIDCASEWWCAGGKAHFIGVSVFETSPRGQYKNNVTGSQDELNGIISRHTGMWHNDTIEAQQDTLERLVATGYEGPAGIDMIVTTDRMLLPCIEVNLRMTMGMASIEGFRVPCYRQP